MTPEMTEFALDTARLFAIVLFQQSALGAFFKSGLYAFLFKRGRITIDLATGEKRGLEHYIGKGVISIAVGMVWCWNLQYDYLSVIASSDPTLIGMILTGGFIGGGSGSLEDWLKARSDFARMQREIQIEAVKRQLNGGGTHPPPATGSGA